MSRLDKINDWIEHTNEAMAFARVSTHRQKDNSPEVQKSEIEAYCRNNKLKLVETFSVIESAKESENRVKYREAIDWAIKNKIRHIVFYMSDREGRNFTDIEANQGLIKKDIIVCHYVKENKFLWKGSSHADFMMREFQAFQDKQVSQIISTKVNDAMRKKAEDGWFPNNHPPLGYIHKYLTDENGREKKRGTIIVPDPDKQVIRQVRREFELCAQGYSSVSIRKQIIDEGFILPSKYKRYSKQGIEHRLKNKFYWGTFDWQGIEYKGKHELIIPKPILDAVAARFGHKKIRRKESEEKGIFSGGWLRCGHPDCGLQITCEHTKKKIKQTGEAKEFRYYRCSNSRGIHKSLKGMYVDEVDLLNKFEPALDKVRISEERAKEIADALNEADGLARKAIDAEIEQYKTALNDLQEKRSRLIDLKLEKGISMQDYEFKMRQIDDDMKHYMKLQEDAQYKITDAWKVTAETVLELAKEAKELWKQGTLTQKLEILKKVCWNPILEGSNLRYDLRKPFATLAEMNEKAEWRPLRDSNSCLLRERELS